MGSGAGAGMGVFTMVLMLVGVVIYFVPAFIAFKREHPQKVSIILLNVLLGWSVIGWVGSLIWAFTNPQKQTIQVVHTSLPREEAKE